jgi:hypothetical protein
VGKKKSTRKKYQKTKGILPRGYQREGNVLGIWMVESGVIIATGGSIWKSVVSALNSPGQVLGFGI